MPNAMPDKTPEVFAYLKECAIKKRTTYYIEVDGRTGAHYRHLDPQLNYICNFVCHPQKLPCLPVLVVRKDKKRPGNGFWRTHADLITGDAESWWKAMVEKVRAYDDWSSVNLPD